MSLFFLGTKSMSNIFKSKIKKLYEGEGEDENYVLDLSQMNTMIEFPYPTIGVTFDCSINRIILDPTVVDSEGELNDDDLSNLLQKVSTVIVTESQKMKRKGRRLFESKRAAQSSKDLSGLSLQELARRIIGKKQP